MQDLHELLRQRERQIEQLHKEIEALRVTISIVEKEEASPIDRKTESAVMLPPNGNGKVAAGAAPKQFP
jgi:hypothetical protein